MGVLFALHYPSYINVYAATTRRDQEGYIVADTRMDAVRVVHKHTGEVSVGGTTRPFQQPAMARDNLIHKLTRTTIEAVECISA